MQPGLSQVLFVNLNEHYINIILSIYTHFAFYVVKGMILFLPFNIDFEI